MPENILTRARDIRCDECGKIFRGAPTQVRCVFCDAKDERAPLDRVQEGRDGEVLAAEAKIYEKRVKVDPDRKKVDMTRRDRGDVTKARAAAMDAIAGESRLDRDKKDPVRTRIDGLRAERDTLAERLRQIETDLVVCLRELEPVGENGNLMKNCYGHYDPGDVECTSMCPLTVECKQTRESGDEPARTVTVVGAERGAERGR